jgi:methionyl aminopeptidase
VAAGHRVLDRVVGSGGEQTGRQHNKQPDGEGGDHGGHGKPAHFSFKLTDPYAGSMTADTPEELTDLARTGSLIAACLADLSAVVAPGMSTAELDARAASFLSARGARSGPILTYDYPGFICVSVNDQVVHGIPGPRTLRSGDLITFDVAAEAGGFYADAARTVAVGEVSGTAQRLMAATQAALRAGVAAARPGARLGDIGAAIERVSQARGFDVFRELTGHGIGREMHEEPTVYNFAIDDPDGDLVLEPGMVFTVEPMLTSGTDRLIQDPDGWTMRSADGALTAHEEHTLVIEADGPRILTAR